MTTSHLSTATTSPMTSFVGFGDGGAMGRWLVSVVFCRPSKDLFVMSSTF
jgi:hypothetical protein